MDQVHRTGKREDAQVAGAAGEVALAPADPRRLNRLGLALFAAGRDDQAIAWLGRALACAPQFAQACNNLGLALSRRGWHGPALARHRQAVALLPATAEAWSNLGAAARAAGRPEQAVAGQHRAARLAPERADFHNHLGLALQQAGRTDAALAAFERALALAPGAADIGWNRGLALLLTGRWEQGWRAYGRGWDSGERGVPRHQHLPAWDGGPLRGRTVLLWCEQGLGDSLQFVRYAPLVAARGGRVVLEVQPPLVGLLAGLAGVAAIIARDQPPPPEVALQAPLLDLARLLGSRPATVPARVPYLAADPARVERWRERLAGLPGRRVGLAWAGSPGHRNDRNRSMPWTALRPLLALPGLSWVSLHKDQPTDGDGSPPGIHAPPLGDLADTAALMGALDLVLTVDTAMAHLAGALARPAWVMLPFAPDWRWSPAGDHSPWYPTLRLLRQRRPGDWAGLVAEIAARLAGPAESDAPRHRD